MAKVKRTFWKFLVATGLTSFLAFLLQGRAEKTSGGDSAGTVPELIDLPNEEIAPPAGSEITMGVSVVSPENSIDKMKAADPFIDPELPMGSAISEPEEPVRDTGFRSIMTGRCVRPNLLPVAGTNSAVLMKALGEAHPELAASPALSNAFGSAILVFKHERRVECYAAEKFVASFDLADREKACLFPDAWKPEIPSGIYTAESYEARPSEGLSLVSTSHRYVPGAFKTGTEGDIAVTFEGDVSAPPEMPLSARFVPCVFTSGTNGSGRIVLSMPDMERLVYCVLRTGARYPKVIVAPYDLREGRKPEWETACSNRAEEIATRLKAYQRPAMGGGLLPSQTSAK